MNFGVGSGGSNWGGGALWALLKHTAERLGVVLRESDEERGVVAKYVDAGSGRRVTVYPPDERRRAFRVNLASDLPSNFPRLAGGWTADPAEVVRAVAAWTSGAGLEETKVQAPCIQFRPWALVHEREPFSGAELEWHLQLDRIHFPPDDRYPRTHALLAAAYAQPVLRRLTPATSMMNVWFSTSVRANWKTHVGHILWMHEKGVYGVHDGSELIARFDTPEEAVALVVATLPEGIGPAR
ncbi:DUF6193 family natural product biosynthesis protein [Kitasatospora sp. NPDC002227]|uniref:DUF6193 family natural product biosynthesis protein n=1 Tax=Kitasatospora sp. NPDC002227 TaxID=3154773 RepID=UPI00331888B6